MPSELLPSFATALLFAAIHLAGRHLDFLSGMPRSVWLSAAGGVSVAYVFLHILPELAAHQRQILEHLGGARFATLIESHVYLLALAGLTIFYGLDRMMLLSDRENSEHPPGIFWTHLGSFAVYNVVIGYLLVQRGGGLSGLLLFGFALGVHFLINDQALRGHHGELYRRRGKWLLAAAPLLGWTLGVTQPVGQLWVSGLFALLAGAIVLNVLKEELPRERESRFSAFVAGAAGYAALLLLI